MVPLVSTDKVFGLVLNGTRFLRIERPEDISQAAREIIHASGKPFDDPKSPYPWTAIPKERIPLTREAQITFDAQADMGRHLMVKQLEEFVKQHPQLGEEAYRIAGMVLEGFAAGLGVGIAQAVIALSVVNDLSPTQPS